MTLVLGTTDPLFPTPSYALGFTVQQILVSHALVLISLICLARSYAAGKSLLAKIGPSISSTKTYYKKRKAITHV